MRMFHTETQKYYPINIDMPNAVMTNNSIPDISLLINERIVA